MNETIGMGQQTRDNMAARLNHLMSKTPALDTNEKLAARSGASYGTVRRIRKAEPIDVSIGHVEDVAKCFGLTLAEFVSDFKPDARNEVLSNHAKECAEIINQMTPNEQFNFLFYLRTEKARKEISSGVENSHLTAQEIVENHAGQ